MQEPTNQNIIGLIAPHGGGSLVNRLLPVGEIKKNISKASSLPQIPITSRNFSDLEMLAIGAFSPLEGFLNERDYENVVLHGRLANDLLWPIPISLVVGEEVKEHLQVGSSAGLVYDEDVVGVIHVESLYSPDKKREAQHVFKTNDSSHPGVAEIFNRGRWHVGGRVEVFVTPEREDFPQFNLTPRDTRRLFQQKNWQTIAGFQTRNPMHRGHEAVVSKALESMDGVLLHPMVGETKEGDISAEIRMKTYEVLVNHYFPVEKVLLAANPGHMYFAGPREAILHAIVRQNYGCSHFIVGRDHAGVNSYYGPTDAQDLINWFSRWDLAIQPIIPDLQLNISGSQIREMLRAGILPSSDLMRPEVSQILIKTLNK